uniref:Uncharacterized protein n=2 Tax=Clytia hemisphaerica TaxID=252671 RepID=A0A7M5XHQ9_9CNID|eukprot:TCONS_00066069-protein
MRTLKEMGVEAVCRVYDPFNIHGMSLTMLLKHADGWDYTRFLLLLSPFDRDLFKDFLNNTGSREPYRIFTPDVAALNRNSFYLENNMIQDIGNAPNDSEANLSFLSAEWRNNENISFRYEAFPQKWKRKIIRVTSSIFPPYNNVLKEKPTKFGQCINAGHLCRVPIKRGNITEGWRECCCGGIAVSLFDLITKQLNIKYDLYLVEDNKFGGKNVTGGWNGMIGELINNKADIAINGFNPTRERLKEVSFTSAYQHDYLSFVKRKLSFEEIDFVNWEFVRTMESDLALWILFSTVFSATFIVFSENIGYLLRSKKYFSTREVMTYIFGLAFQRDMGGRNPLRWGGRVVALSYAASMTVIMTTYTAHLTAKNIQIVPKNTFLGLKDQRLLKPTDDFKIALMSATSFEAMFRDGSEDYKRFWAFSKKYAVSSNSEGVEKVYTGELDAFIIEAIASRTITSHSKYCENLEVFVENKTQMEVSFPYRKDFPLGEEISRQILKVREDYKIKDIIERWVYIPQCTSSMKNFTKFDVNYFGGIIFICAILLLVSIFLILAENFHTHVKMRRRTRCRQRSSTSITNISF